MPWASWRPCWELLFFSSSIESLAEERGGADGWDEATVVRGPQLVDGNVVGGFAEVMLVLEEYSKGDGRRDHPRHEDDAAENDEAESELHGHHRGWTGQCPQALSLSAVRLHEVNVRTRDRPQRWLTDEGLG